MIVWLIAICLFWLLTAIYLGGLNLEIEGGGGVRQTVGLLASFALFLLVWWGLRQALGGIGPILGGVILPSAISALAIPLIVRVGFRLLGVRIRRGAGHGGHGEPGHGAPGYEPAGEGHGAHG